MREELAQCLCGDSATSREQKIDNYIQRMNLPSSRQSNYKSKGGFKRKSYVNIFAILVLTEKTASIGDFLDEEIDDSALPLASQARRKSRRLELFPRRGSKNRIKAFDRWSHDQKFNFIE